MQTAVIEEMDSAEISISYSTSQLSYQDVALIKHLELKE